MQQDIAPLRGNLLFMDKLLVTQLKITLYN